MRVRQRAYTVTLALLLFLSLQRLSELVIAKRNTQQLLLRGAYEVGASHYPVMVGLHGSWLASLWWFGHDRVLSIPFVVAFVVLQLGRAWVLSTLGRRWTTRIIIVPDERPITRGPFRFVRHPNYLIVAFELPCVSLALGLMWHALVFGVLNLLVLAWRTRCENRAFALVTNAA